MAKTETPSFIVKRRIIVNKSQYDRLEKLMNITERMYNAGVKYCIRQLKELKKDVWYQKCLKAYKECKDEEKCKILGKEIFLCAAAYGLTEYNLHDYFGKGKVSGYDKGIGINIAQKNATALYSAVKKAIFGKQIHYRKHGDTCSFEDKKAISGIIYRPKTDTVKIMGEVYSLKSVRKSDIWLQEAMTYRVKYCRVVREPFGIHYRYFLQIVMEGIPPQKHVIGEGTLAIDPGISTMTAYTGKELFFEELAPNVKKYQETVIREQNRFSKLMRVNNPDCYDVDGKPIKGHRIQYSESMKRSRMRIRSAFRKQREYVRQSNNHLANQFVEAAGTTVKIETMNYKALSRKSSKTERQDKPSVVISDNGKKKTVYKYKKRKRFGGSILKHAPSQFLETVKKKVTARNGTVIDVKASKLKASQYDHTTRKYIKTELDTRNKEIGGHTVQRDCYSSFIIYHATEESTPDRTTCRQDFDNFLQCQDTLVEKMIKDNFRNDNFGTRLLETRKTEKQQTI